MAAQRPIGPPPVFHKPGFPDRLDLPTIHQLRAAVLAGADGNPAGNSETTRTAHLEPC